MASIQEDKVVDLATDNRKKSLPTSPRSVPRPQSTSQAKPSSGPVMINVIGVNGLVSSKNLNSVTHRQSVSTKSVSREIGKNSSTVVPLDSKKLESWPKIIEVDPKPNEKEKSGCLCFGF